MFIWLDSPAWGMQFIQRYHDNSLVYGSPQAERIAKAAKDHTSWWSWATARSTAAASTWAQWIIGADGETIAHAAQAEADACRAHRVWRRRRQRPARVRHPLGRVGALCCWEHLQPLSKYAMYAQNEQVHIAAWPSFSLYRGGAYALGPEVNNAASQIYAVEGQCFVIAPCATSRRR